MPHISRTTQSGFIEIKLTKELMAMSDQIDLKTLTYEAAPGVWSPIFTIEVVPSDEQEPDNVKMDWAIVLMTPSRIEI